MNGVFGQRGFPVFALIVLGGIVSWFALLSPNAVRGELSPEPRPVTAPGSSSALLAVSLQEETARLSIPNEASRKSEVEAVWDQEGWSRILGKIRDASPADREKWLASRNAFFNCPFPEMLFGLAGREAIIGKAIERLTDETDPLVQAVLIDYLSYQRSDKRVYPALDAVVRKTVGDSSRRTLLEISLFGALEALGFQNQNPHEIVYLVIAHETDPTLLRTMFYELYQGGFLYDQVQDLLQLGLEWEHPTVQMGALAAVLGFKRKGMIASEKVLSLLGPSIERQPDKQRRLWILREVGYALRQEGHAFFVGFLRECKDEETALAAASCLGLYSEPGAALASLIDLAKGSNILASRAAIYGLGVLPSEDAARSLVDLYYANASNQERRWILKNLVGKNAELSEFFADAIYSSDSEIQEIAMDGLLYGAALSQEGEQQRRKLDLIDGVLLHSKNAAVRSKIFVAKILFEKEKALPELFSAYEKEEASETRISIALSLFAFAWAKADQELLTQTDGLLEKERSSLVLALIQRGKQSFTKTTTGKVKEDLRKNREFLRLMKAQNDLRPGESGQSQFDLKLTESLLSALNGS